MVLFVMECDLATIPPPDKCCQCLGRVFKRITVTPYVMGSVHAVICFLHNPFLDRGRANIVFEGKD